MSQRPRLDVTFAFGANLLNTSFSRTDSDNLILETLSAFDGSWRSDLGKLDRQLICFGNRNGGGEGDGDFVAEELQELRNKSLFNHSSSQRIRDRKLKGLQESVARLEWFEFDSPLRCFVDISWILNLVPNSDANTARVCFLFIDREMSHLDAVPDILRHHRDKLLLVPIILPQVDGTPPSQLLVNQCVCLSTWTQGLVLQPSCEIPKFPRAFMQSMWVLIAFPSALPDIGICHAELFGRRGSVSPADVHDAVEFYKEFSGQVTFFFGESSKSVSRGWVGVKDLETVDIPDRASFYTTRPRIISVEFGILARRLSEKIATTPLAHVLRDKYKKTPPTCTSEREARDDESEDNGSEAEDDGSESDSETDYRKGEGDEAKENCDRGEEDEHSDRFVVTNLRELLARVGKLSLEDWEEVEIRVKRSKGRSTGEE